MNISPLITPVPIIDKTPININLWQAVITAAFAVVSGFILYAIKTSVDEKWLRRYREYKKLKASIAYILIMYANVYLNPTCESSDLTVKAENALRVCAARLGSFVEEWPKGYLGIPKQELLLKAHDELIGLSNRVCTNSKDLLSITERNENAQKTIKELLGIKH